MDTMTHLVNILAQLVRQWTKDGILFRKYGGGQVRPLLHTLKDKTSALVTCQWYISSEDTLEIKNNWETWQSGGLLHSILANLHVEHVAEAS